MPARQSALAVRFAASGAILGALLLPGCRSQPGHGDVHEPGREAGEVLIVHYGQLVDLYGLRSRNGTSVIELFRTDMLVGPEIQDKQVDPSTLDPAKVRYDFLPSNPDTLQPRLLINREIDTRRVAVRYDEQGNSYVYVVNTANQIAIAEIETGLDNGEHIEITAGLNGNERVVGPLLRRLKAGQKVKVEG